MRVWRRNGICSWRGNAPANSRRPCGAIPTKLFERLYGDQPDRWDDVRDGEAAPALHRQLLHPTALRRRGWPLGAARQGIAEEVADRVADSLVRGARARAGADPRIVFGHWSTLGFFRNADVIGLDTGCVWGSTLTALRLDDPEARPVQVPCAARAS